jgi:hypothetical protein
VSETRLSAATMRVTTRGGDTREASPHLFFIGRRTIEVIEIIDRWIDIEHSYFKLRGSDSGIYILRHDAGTGDWEMILFDSGTRQETRLSST